MITKQDMEKIANLARLELSDEEVTRYADQLGTIIGYVDQLNALDTADIVPTAHASEVSNVFREDVVAPFADRELIIRNAPQFEDDAFVVPKII